MVASADGFAKRLLRGISLAAAALAGSVAIWLASAHGFSLSAFGARITVHDPVRPAIAAIAALVVYRLAGGSIREILRLIGSLGRADDRLIAGILSCATVIAGLAFGTFTAGGADPYGYVSQADLWSGGALKIQQPWALEAPWPSRQWTFTPLGYRPGVGADIQAIVPTYSPGLPMAMAAAKVVAGACAVYWIVPIAGGLLVLSTYGIGRGIGTPRAGLLAAWFVATSPSVLLALVQPMTDVPVAAAWAAAFWCLLGRGWLRAAAAGLAVSAAILIRPNLVPGAAILGLWLVWRLWIAARGQRAGAWISLAAFAGLSAIGPAATAAINAHLYGSPLSSGYGPLSDMFGRANVLPNVVRYLSWTVQAETILPLVGLIAIVVPLRRVWPAASDRVFFAIAALFVIALWAQYFFYLVFDNWTYLRFVLAGWPFLMLGLAAAGLALARRLPRALGIAIVAALVGLGVRNVVFAAREDLFTFWQTQQRYISVGQLVRQLTEPNSVLFAKQHSGTGRYYGGRLTVRYDFMDRTWLDRSLEWFAARGIHAYLLGDEWEIRQFKERFAGQHAVTFLDVPRIEYRGRENVYVFDLQGVPARVQTYEDRFDRGRCVPPAPYPSLVTTGGAR